MLLQMKVDAARGDEVRTRSGALNERARPAIDTACGSCACTNRFGLADDPRQLPGRRQVDFVAGCESDEIGPFGGAAIELAFAVRDEHGAVPHGAQPENRQEDLVLSAAPGAGGVDVEGEHSSHSFANFRPT